MRHSKTVNGVVTTHVWNRGHIVLERNATGAVNNRFFMCITGRLIQSEHHGFYLYNVRGDVVQRTNAQGNVTATYRYTAFGNEINPYANNNNRFRFSGEYWDAHRGEIYLRARSFDPRTGRFTQPDPHWNINNMIFGDNQVMRNDRLVPSVRAIAQAGNLFIYCINNPVMWVDPSGKFVNLAAFAHWVRTGIRETAAVAATGTKESVIDGGGGIGVAGRIKIPHGQNIANQRAKTGTPRPTFNTTANTSAPAASGPATGAVQGPVPPTPAASSTTARVTTPQAQVQTAANASGGQLRVTAPQAQARNASHYPVNRFISPQSPAQSNPLPANARTTTNPNEVFRRLETYHGVPRHVASQRLHEIKPSAGRGPADNVIFDLTGNIYDPVTGHWLGSLTMQ